MEFNTQKGFSLLLVLVVIMLLGLTSTMFMHRSGDEMATGASRRDSGIAIELAENAANLILFRFISKDLNVADMNGNGLEDRAEGYVNISANPAILNLPYAFYTEPGNNIPPIQRIATGESMGTSATILSQSIPSNSNAMLVNDLFVSTTIRPYLFTQSPNGLSQSDKTWDAETAKNKAAVWMEYEINKENPAWVDLYVAAAAKVGNARGYVRRYVGTYTDELGGMISPITESAIHAGGDTALDTCTIC